jgi:DNA-binding transcriptional LysR family regulator
MAEARPQVKVEAREVYGADIPDLLLDERFDLAVAPMTSYPRGLRVRAVRREPVRIALSKSDPLARRRRVPLTAVADRLFEVWPRDMAPGFYDIVVAMCRTAGFEPMLDERATGNTVWGNLARGRGVALINASLAQQLPPGVTLVDLAEPAATITYQAIWRDAEAPIIQGSLDVVTALATARGWL